jgi:hypothetical protein
VEGVCASALGTDPNITATSASAKSSTLIVRECDGRACVRDIRFIDLTPFEDNPREFALGVRPSSYVTSHRDVPRARVIARFSCATACIVSLVRHVHRAIRVCWLPPLVLGTSPANYRVDVGGQRLLIHLLASSRTSCAAMTPTSVWFKSQTQCPFILRHLSGGTGGGTNRSR